MSQRGQYEIRKRLEKLLRGAGVEDTWEGIVGDAAGTITVPGQSDLRYVRPVGSGLPVVVHRGIAQDLKGLHVKIGRWYKGDRMRIMGVAEGGGSNVGVDAHAETHYEDGSDPVWITDRQITPLLVCATTGMYVHCNGGEITYQGKPVHVEKTDLDLSSSIPVSGARYSLIRLSSAGVWSVQDGTPVDSLADLADDDVPTCAVGYAATARVRLYYGQTSLSKLTTNPDVKMLVWGNGLFYWGGSFIDLDDAIDAYTGLAGQYVKVNATETGLETGTPAGAGDMSWSEIQVSQLVNEIKGWPPVVQPDADLDALNLWWDKVGTPTTAPTVVDLAGEGGITETWELALKLVADAANEGLSQRWTYADEPRVKSGRKLSVLLAIWSVSAVEVTAKLVNSDASETAASAVTAAGWTIVEIPNHTLAGTYCDLQVTAGAAGTFYVVPLGANIGQKAFPLGPRGERYIDSGAGGSILPDADPGAVWTDLDCTATTSPLATKICGNAFYMNATSLGKDFCLRRNGDSKSAGFNTSVVRAGSTNLYFSSRFICPLDDNQILEYIGSDVAADTEHCWIALQGWWEWE